MRTAIVDAKLTPLAYSNESLIIFRLGFHGWEIYWPVGFLVL